MISETMVVPDAPDLVRDEATVSRMSQAQQSGPLRIECCLGYFVSALELQDHF